MRSVKRVSGDLPAGAWLLRAGHTQKGN